MVKKVMAPKNPAAVVLGRKGGKATARNRTPEERAEAARKAVKARWAKTKEGLNRLLKVAEAREAARKAKAKKLKAEKV